MESEFYQKFEEKLNKFYPSYCITFIICYADCCIPKGFRAENELNLLLTSGVLQLNEKGNVYPGKAMTRAEIRKSSL